MSTHQTPSGEPAAATETPAERLARALGTAPPRSDEDVAAGSDPVDTGA